MKRTLVLLVIVTVCLFLCSCNSEGPDDNYTLTEEQLNLDLYKIEPAFETRSMAVESIYITSQEYDRDSKTVKAAVEITAFHPLYYWKGNYEVEYSVTGRKLVFKNVCGSSDWSLKDTVTLPSEDRVLNELLSVYNLELVEAGEGLLEDKEYTVEFTASGREGKSKITVNGTIVFLFDLDSEAWVSESVTKDNVEIVLNYDDNISGVFDVLITDECIGSSEGMTLSCYRVYSVNYSDNWIRNNLAEGQIIKLSDKTGISGRVLEDIYISQLEYEKDSLSGEIVRIYINDRRGHSAYYYLEASAAGQWELYVEDRFGDYSGKVVYLGEQTELMFNRKTVITKESSFDNKMSGTVSDIRTLFTLNGTVNGLFAQIDVFEGVVQWSRVLYGVNN